MSARKGRGRTGRAAPSREVAALAGASRFIRAILRCDSRHPELAAVLDVIERLQHRPVSTNVLLRGEAGTGKEGLARALHALMSGGRDAPFVEVHAIGRAQTLERELFGPKGLCARADGGTLFFDEIADLPGEVQWRLADLLRWGGGDHRAQKSSRIRAIACTERDLAAMVQGRQFRHDLYFRLARLVLTLPPLRERPGDVRRNVIWIGNRVLSRHGDERTLQLAQDRDEGPGIALGDEAVEVLCQHSWPGNFRELEAVMERALLIFLGEETVLRAEHIRRALA